MSSTQIYDSSQKHPSASFSFFNPTNFFERNGFKSTFLDHIMCPVCLEPISTGQPISTLEKCNHVMHSACFRSCPLHEESDTRALLFRVHQKQYKAEDGCYAGSMIALPALGICLYLIGNELQKMI